MIFEELIMWALIIYLLGLVYLFSATEDSVMDEIQKNFEEYQAREILGEQDDR